MRITRNMLEPRIKDLNRLYGLDLSVKYFNGATWVYHLGTTLTVGTTPYCYTILSIFVSGCFCWNGYSV